MRWAQQNGAHAVDDAVQLPALFHRGFDGLLHLLGYDHQTDAEEAEMNARVKERGSL